jgi:PAS domain S-box-containing protein
MGDRPCELLHLILTATNDGVVDWDLRENRATYSERWKMLLGYEPEELEDSPALWRELSHPDDLPGVDQEWSAHLDGAWPFCHTWRLRHKHGGWRWLLCRAVLVAGAEGRATRSVSIYTDITDQMRAEERHRALATAVPDLLVRVDVQGRVMDVKPHETRTAVLLADFAAGQKLADRIAPELHALVMDAVGRAISQQVPIEIEYADAARASHLEIRVVRSGDDEAVLIARDITARKRREGALVQLARRTEALLESVGEGICAIGEDQRIWFANSEAGRLLGRSADELVGMRAAEALAHGGHAGSACTPQTCALLAPLADGGVHGLTRDIFTCKDGSALPVEIISAAAREDGRLIGVVVTFRDLRPRGQAAGTDRVPHEAR